MIRRPVGEQHVLTLHFAGFHLWCSNPHVWCLIIHIWLVVYIDYSCCLKARCPSHLYVSRIPCVLLIRQWMLLSYHSGCCLQSPCFNFPSLLLLTSSNGGCWFNPPKHHLPSHSIAMMLQLQVGTPNSIVLSCSRRRTRCSDLAPIEAPQLVQ